MERILLAIDCGTQSIRAILFSETGSLVDKIQEAYEPYFSTNPGWAEQDPDLYWRKLCDACQQLKAKRPKEFERIAGVGVTTLRASMVNVDAQGRVLRPTMTWLDQRKAKVEFCPGGWLKWAIKLIGAQEIVEKAQTDGKCNWIRQNQPDIWQKTHKYLQVSGFLNFRLTGEFIDSVASQIGHIPMNYRTQQWGKPSEIINLAARLFPVEPEKLPVLKQPGEIIGRVTPSASEQTGIAKGTPVVACGSDKGCETIGMGVLDQSMASLSFGTTATVQTTSKKYFETISLIPPYPAPIPGYYNPEVEIFRGYWMITWFKNEFAHKEVQEAAEKGLPPEAVMDKLLHQAPAGSMGLVVQPYWSPGLKEPDAKGAMIGFGDVHTKAHVYRAVIEGLAYGLLDGIERMQQKGKAKFHRVAVSGGASQSDEICKISADIVNLPLVRGTTFETSGLGAALVTSVGAGIHASFKDAVENMVHYDRTFEPDPANRAIYRELYERVYKRMYPVMEPLYKEIRDITGYPEK